jgi:hypothetical protein
MATIESIQKAYIDFVLTEGQQPKSVYIFAKKNKMAEEEFYQFFGSFNAIEQNIWTGFALKTIAEPRKFGASIRPAKKRYLFSTAFLS